jgi:hypothetical protein
VGPWDIDDIPPLTDDLKSKLIPDPVKSIPVRGYKFEYEGLTIELKDVGRTISQRIDGALYPNLRSWTPAGGPCRHREWGSSMGMAGSDREGSGARYLAFALSSADARDVSLYGYVPDSAHSGSTPPEERGFGRGGEIQVGSPKGYTGQGSQEYRPGVVLDNDCADRFFLGVADGPWKTVGVCSDLPKQVSKDTEIKEPWGTVTVRPMPDPFDSGPSRSGGPKFHEGSQVPPCLTVRVDPSSEPRRYAYRFSLLDAKGEVISKSTFCCAEGYCSSDQCQCDIFSWKGVDRIVVEGRPLTYFEFKNIHYYPDARLWP